MFRPLTEEEYRKNFGIAPNGKNYKKSMKLQKKAFKKAWEIRNFEIDKFWQRSAYFWGFIALIFGGYVGIITGKSSVVAKEMYFDLYLVLLGMIFSFGWLLVICGSIRWQENWEAHIDELEDGITGPLYKIVYCTKKQFYSVSKISRILACVVIITWGLLLVQYISANCNIIKRIFECLGNSAKEFFFVLVPIIGTVVCIIILLKKGRTSSGEYKMSLEDEKGEFFERTKRSSALKDS
jgi:hypothetical protein